MRFHHLDGFFNFTILICVKNGLMLVINLRLNYRLFAVLIGKDRNSAAQAFGGFGQAGIAAVAVKNEMKFIGAAVPGFSITCFCGFSSAFQNQFRLGEQLFLFRGSGGVADGKAVQVAHERINFPKIVGGKADDVDADI